MFINSRDGIKVEENRRRTVTAHMHPWWEWMRERGDDVMFLRYDAFTYETKSA